MKIVIETIPHKDQRYDTVGDYWEDPDGTWQFRVSEFGVWQEQFLVVFHELIEKVLCDQNKITGKSIDEFDMNWKDHDGLVEPGNDPSAPYHDQHLIATAYERLLASHLNVEWNAYDERLDAL